MASGLRAPIRAVVFDYGAVICRLPSPAEWAEFADAADLSIDAFIRSYPFTREEYDRGRIRAAEYWRSFAAVNGRHYDAAAIRRLSEIDIRVWSHIDDAVVEFARALQTSGVKTGILSNMQPDFLDVLRHEQPDWLAAFDASVFSCDVGFVKPERQIYEHLIDKLAVPSREVLFVDDVAMNVDGAKNAGMQAAVFTSIDDVRQLLDSTV